MIEVGFVDPEYIRKDKKYNFRRGTSCRELRYEHYIIELDFDSNEENTSVIIITKFYTQ